MYNIAIMLFIIAGILSCFAIGVIIDYIVEKTKEFIAKRDYNIEVSLMDEEEKENWFKHLRG